MLAKIQSNLTYTAADVISIVTHTVHIIGHGPA